MLHVMTIMTAQASMYMCNLYKIVSVNVRLCNRTLTGLVAFKTKA